ncbi:MAG: ATP-binding cassette domain-containing protein, partial [Erysipelotrichaceae bacterium]|nr:ATP-binding cassette domain-containing protein [Erysipelotrichaceae bacterium]
MSENIAVQLQHITKSFGPVRANDDVSFDIRQHEILALLGENGRGKTTIMNMLAGIYYPDDGDIFIRGEKVTIQDPSQAYALGIGMVHQHYKLIDAFSALENIVLGLKPITRNDLEVSRKKVQEICERYGFELDLDMKVYDMSVSQKQTLEIVKVLYRGAEILILDEPTSVLTPQEIQKLFNVIRNMRDDGKAIVIITHKLNEVMEISDRVTVLRKGRFIATVPTSQTDYQKLTELMVGEKVSLDIRRDEPHDVVRRLEISHLTVINEENRKVLDDVSFTVNSGEILGIAGIAGSGQKELLESIAGLQDTEPGASVVFSSPEGKDEQLIGKTPRQI